MRLILNWFWYLLPANPVVVRIVQGGSRRRRHLWVRSAYLGLLVGLVLFGLATSGGMGDHTSLTDLAKSGAVLFTTISYGQVLLICLVSPLFMSGAIAEQKAGRTYDILLSTPLSNLQIVLGSLVGRLFFVWALLASGLPLFSVLLVFGGVPLEAILVSFVVAAVSALLVGSVAVAISVRAKSGRRAVVVFMTAVGVYLVVVYCVDLFVLRSITGHATAAGLTTTWLTPLHPILVLAASFDTPNYRLPEAEQLGHLHVLVRYYLCEPLGVFVWLSLLLSGVLILASAAGLRRAGERSGRPVRWHRLAQRCGLGLLATDRRRPPRRMWTNPIAWRQSKTHASRLGRVLARGGFVVAALAAAVGVLVLYHRGLLPPVADPLGQGMRQPHGVLRLLISMLLLVELALIALIAVYTSGSCASREREDGSIDLILTTPVTPRQYIWGKLRGLGASLMLLMAVPIVTLLIAAAYSQAGGMLNWPQATVRAEFFDTAGVVSTKNTGLILPEAPLLAAATIVPFVALCVVVGLSWSLKAKSVLGAVAPAVGIVGCATAVMGFCGSNLASNVPLVGGVVSAVSPVTCVMVLVDPWQYLSGFASDPVTGRLGLWLGAVVAGGGYSMLVYVMVLTMIQSFDQTVRRISGGG